MEHRVGQGAGRKSGDFAFEWPRDSNGPAPITSLCGLVTSNDMAWSHKWLPPRLARPQHASLRSSGRVRRDNFVRAAVQLQTPGLDIQHLVAQPLDQIIQVRRDHDNAGVSGDCTTWGKTALAPALLTGGHEEPAWTIERLWVSSGPDRVVLEECDRGEWIKQPALVFLPVATVKVLNRIDAPVVEMGEIA